MKKVIAALLEDYSASPVPVQQGKGWLQIGVVYWGIAIDAMLVAATAYLVLIHLRRASS